MKVRTIEILYETPFRREDDPSPVLASVTIAKGQIWASGSRYVLTDEEKQAVLDHHHATQLREWAEFLESDKMSEPIERCLCGEKCFAAADVDGVWWAECRECCYRSPLVGDLASTIATHNRMMRAARGEAVSSTLVTVEHSSPLELARRMQDEWARIVSQLEKEAGK